jgi:BirA family biotin operon repressor/biotin-[acetyl-CoA-carboxylase] ligase
MAQARRPSSIVRFDIIDSTNDEARRRAEAGEPGLLWLLAARQTAGRGRRGHTWLSPPGNLHLTGLFTLAAPPAQAALLSYAAAVAAAQALEMFGATDLRLKWPNDVWAGDAKLAGVLLESGLGPAGRWLAVGIGANLAEAPEIAGRRTISLAALTVRAAPAPDDVAAVLAERFEHWLERFKATGFAEIRAAWLARAFGRGEMIEAQAPAGAVVGRFETLDEAGALIVIDTAGVRHAVTAGEVFFPPPAKE